MIFLHYWLNLFLGIFFLFLMLFEWNKLVFTDVSLVLCLEVKLLCDFVSETLLNVLIHSNVYEIISSQKKKKNHIIC